MKISRLISLFIIGTILLSTLTGCEYFWPDDGNNKAELPPAVNAAKNTYYSEQVKLGTVIKTKKKNLLYISNLSMFSTTLDTAEYPLFTKGEKGTLYIPIIYSGEPNKDKYLEYNAIVVTGASDISNKLYVKIVGDYDKTALVDAKNSEFTVVEARKDNVIAIPISATKKYHQKTIVGVLVNGIHIDKEVKTGLIGDETVEIVSGLSVGESLIFK